MIKMPMALTLNVQYYMYMNDAYAENVVAIVMWLRQPF